MSLILFWGFVKKMRNKNVAESKTRAVYRFTNKQLNYYQVYLNTAFRSINITVPLFLNNISKKKKTVIRVYSCRQNDVIAL